MSASRAGTSALPQVAREQTPRGNALEIVRRAGALGGTCLIAALFAPWIVLAGSGRKILVAIVLLDIPLQIDQNFAYLDDAARLGALGGFGISLTTLALTGLYAGWLIESLVTRRRMPRARRDFDEGCASSFQLIRPLALYLLLVVASVVAAADLGLSARGLFLLMQMFLLFVYLVCWVRTRQDVRFVTTMLLCGLMLESAIIVGLGDSVERLELAGFKVFVDMSTQELGAARVFGTLGSPILAGAYFEMLLAPAVAVLATNLGRGHKLVAVVAIGLSSVALIGTLSRAAWAAAALSMATTCLAFQRRGGLRLAIPLLFVAFLAGVFLAFQATITTRLTADDDGSARGRVPLMATALEIIADNPVLGIGINSYTAALPHYESTFKGDWLYTVHNKYLLVWAEAGIGGLVAFLWFLGATVRRGWNRWRSPDPLLSPLALGFTAGLVGQMVHMFVDVFSSRSQVQLLWVVAALIAAMSRIEASRRWPPHSVSAEA